MEGSKETCDLLEKLSRDITETLNKIESRETYINRALDVDINEYSVKSAQLAEVSSNLTLLEKKDSTTLSGSVKFFLRPLLYFFDLKE